MLAIHPGYSHTRGDGGISDGWATVELGRGRGGGVSFWHFIVTIDGPYMTPPYLMKLLKAAD